MNVVQVLLVAGLIYIAMKQKSDKNRNLILVITGLLAFCMMGTEGLAMISGAEISASCTATDVTVARDVAACAAVTLTGTPAACEAVPNCTYTPLSYGPPRDATAAGSVRLRELVNIFSTTSNPCSAGKLITDNGTCGPAPAACVVKDMNAFCKENSLYKKYDATGGNGNGTCSVFV